MYIYIYIYICICIYKYIYIYIYIGRYVSRIRPEAVGCAIMHRHAHSSIFCVSNNVGSQPYICARDPPPRVPPRPSLRELYSAYTRYPFPRLAIYSLSNFSYFLTVHSVSQIFPRRRGNTRARMRTHAHALSLSGSRISGQ